MEIVGILSAGLLLFAFIANEYGKLPSESIWYDLFNFLAAVGLFAYAYHLDALPFMVTNGVWGLVSGIDVVKDLMRARGLKKRH
ncbi:hypothetical protein A2755_03145 [Candidatus Wolfebacteria bacterium RIFCSPHIGHO2_01_FULL_48_22]|uniref:CBU-0592-like domain-containing protein n=1 Tax=Candidatus Wolfebacteria bacterium RIFCSPHIGHO2_01_FULL_48_22 TaxID=1802555 RepID=A0A1F8DT64_9BACT|nr:MAG: hypothetical protein A2755_03145 [Candidatus Wolfebacteria bacterium RIFCSPHIGHO2_01_FULL_48_22]